MAKQEEIREGIAIELQRANALEGGNKSISDYYPLAQRIMQKQGSQGVVIKAENQTIWLLEASEAYKKGQSDLLKAGYVAVEPLIEVE